MTDIVERLRTESGVNYPEGKYLAEIMDEAADEIERLRDLVERANSLAYCVFKGETKADRERARHNATVLINDIARGKP